MINYKCLSRKIQKAAEIGLTFRAGEGTRFTEPVNSFERKDKTLNFL